jgi:hypothetical protein
MPCARFRTLVGRRERPPLGDGVTVGIGGAGRIERLGTRADPAVPVLDRGAEVWTRLVVPGSYGRETDADISLRGFPDILGDSVSG